MNEIPASAQPPAEAAAAEQTDAAQPGARSTLRFLISCAVVFMAGAGAILLIPHLDSGRVRGTQPGFVTFFGVGLVLILLTGGLVYFGLRSRFRTVPLVMVNIGVYNSLLVLVKFAFAPASLYAANVKRPLQAYLGSDPLTTAIVGAGLFALYAAAFWFLHGLITSRFVSWSGRFVLWLLPMLVVGLLTATGAWVLVLLKDFRDRAGDARYGKPTLLLRHGKTATCAVSGIALLAGDVGICLGLRPDWPGAGVVQVFVAGIALLLLQLWRAGESEAEQAAIGLGARLGNGLLLTILAWLVMVASGSPPPVQLAFGVLLLVAYGGSVLALATNPGRVQIGYRG